jgi:hypothetical protein
MKNQNRVRQNASAKAAAQQAPSPKEKHQTQHRNRPLVGVSLFYIEDGLMPGGAHVKSLDVPCGALVAALDANAPCIAGVPLGPEVESLETDGKVTPDAIARFAVQAMREKLQRSEVPWGKLEAALNEAEVFNELLMTFIWHNTEGVGRECPMSKEEAGPFNAGLITLQFNVMGRLRAARQAVREAGNS